MEGAGELNAQGRDIGWDIAGWGNGRPGLNSCFEISLRSGNYPDRNRRHLVIEDSMLDEPMIRDLPFAR